MPRPRKPQSLTDLLRAELAAVPSVNAVAQATGLSQPTLARFLRGTTDSLTFDTVSVLLDHFDYVIVKRAAATPTKSKPNAAKRRTPKR